MQSSQPHRALVGLELKPRSESLKPITWCLGARGGVLVACQKVFGAAITKTAPRARWSRSTKGARRERVEDGQVVVVLPASYAPDPGLIDHLEFALKYDTVNLEVLSALFGRVDQSGFEQQLAAFVRERPTGQYGRRLWFLYELLTGRRLALDDVSTGNYVELLDEAEFFTGAPQRSRRHRVIDNLLGDVRFCPIVRRTPELERFVKSGLRDEVQRPTSTDSLTPPPWPRHSHAGSSRP